MESVLADLPLDGEVKATLLGQESAFKDLFDLAICYEKRNRRKTGELAAKLKISDDDLFLCYLNSVELSEVITLA